MKFSRRASGMMFAIIKTNRGLRSIPLHTTSSTDAIRIADDLNLADVERAALVGTVTRDLIRKLTTQGITTVARGIEVWSAWMLSTCDSANTQHARATYANAWMRELRIAGTDLNEINEKDIDCWVNKDDGCKVATRKFRLATLRSLFKYCKEKNFCEHNPAALVVVRRKDLKHEQKETRPKRVFTDEEYQQLISWLKDKIQKLKFSTSEFSDCSIVTYKFWLAATIIGRQTALRIGDIASLQWASFTEDRLVVHTDKTNARVDLPLTEDLKHLMTTVRRTESRYCFPEQALIESNPAKKAALSTQFSRILRYAGIKSHRFHELRATRLTEVVQSGAGINVAAAIAGHASTKTTEGYIVTN
jgi:integrase